MQAGLEYYSEMFRALKRELPAGAHQGAHRGRDRAHCAHREDVVRGRADRAARGRPRHAAGRRRGSLQRGVREQIADKKLGGADYIDVHRTAHRLGIRSNCTMLYGHVETIEDRVEHLGMLRDLQDETGGFLAYIPLAYHPDNNELGVELGRAGHRDDRLRRPAQSRGRPALPRQLRAHQDALDHGHAVPVADRAAFGVNDLEGTVVREKIYHEAGAHTAQAMSLDEIAAS